MLTRRNKFVIILTIRNTFVIFELFFGGVLRLKNPSKETKMSLRMIIVSHRKNANVSVFHCDLSRQKRYGGLLCIGRNW